MERALTNWYAARQREAMVEQFRTPDPREEGERLGWKRIRRAAAERKLKRPWPLGTAGDSPVAAKSGWSP